MWVVESPVSEENDAAVVSEDWPLEMVGGMVETNTMPVSSLPVTASEH